MAEDTIMTSDTVGNVRSKWLESGELSASSFSIFETNKNNTPYSNINSEEVPYYSKINKNKECYFSFCSGTGNPDLYNLKDEWKHKDNNHLCEVNDAVRLFCESPKISMSYELQTKKPTQLGAVKGMMDKVSSVLDTVATLANDKNEKGEDTGTSSMHTGKLGSGKEIRQTGIGTVAEYTDSDVFTGVSPLKIDSTLKFEFRFGQFGLFNALEEVVKPIAVLSSVFAPQTNSENIAQAFVPYPTESQWTAAILKNVATMFEDGKITAYSKKEADEKKETEAKDAGFSGSGLQQAVDLQNQLFNSIHGTITQVLADSGWGEREYKYAYFQWGKFVLGPCTIKSVKVEFDSTMIDSNGWPYSGSISLGGITSYANATSNRIKKFYGVGV